MRGIAKGNQQVDLFVSATRHTLSKQACPTKMVESVVRRTCLATR